MSFVRHRGETGHVDVVQHFAAEGSEALDRVIDAFERSHRRVSIQNRKLHISMLRLYVRSHILTGEAPDVWDEWPGKNIEPAVDAGVVADISSIWTDSEMADQYVEVATEMARFDGDYRCVPLNLYRINNLFYNVSACERAGIDPGRLDTPAAFLDCLETLDDPDDASPLVAFGRDPFGLLQFWETLFIAHGGASAYQSLLDGAIGACTGVVREATESLDSALEYAPEDIQFLSSVDADDRFSDGEGVFLHNGDWSIGRFGSMAHFEYGRDWDCVAFPGTEDVFQLNMDALVASAHADRPDDVAAFLAFAGSKRGLELFNVEAESVPPRRDVATDSLHALTRDHADALNRCTDQLPSITHGLGADADQVISLKSAIVAFLENRDVDEFVDAVTDALGAD